MLELLFKYPDSSLDGYDKDFNTNEWLFKKGNFMATWEYNGENAANIIQAGCFAYNINQRFMLMTLQREQGLIEDNGIIRTTIPDQMILDRAAGCGDFDDGSVDNSFKGFKNQIYGAAGTYRHWFKVYTPDMQAELLDADNKTCICKSAVTFALIKYTPHSPVIDLNNQIWERYFV